MNRINLARPVQSVTRSFLVTTFALVSPAFAAWNPDAAVWVESGYRAALPGRSDIGNATARSAPDGEHSLVVAVSTDLSVPGGGFATCTGLNNDCDQENIVRMWEPHVYNVSVRMRNDRIQMIPWGWASTFPHGMGFGVACGILRTWDNCVGSWADDFPSTLVLGKHARVRLSKGKESLTVTTDTHGETVRFYHGGITSDAGYLRFRSPAWWAACSVDTRCANEFQIPMWLRTGNWKDFSVVDLSTFAGWDNSPTFIEVEFERVEFRLEPRFDPATGAYAWLPTQDLDYECSGHLFANFPATFRWFDSNEIGQSPPDLPLGPNTADAFWKHECQYWRSPYPFVAVRS